MTQRLDCALSDGGAGEAPVSPGKLARHLVECGACLDSLSVMRADGALVLGTEASPGAGRPLVERAVSAAVRAGERALGDLLYDMSRACVAIAPKPVAPCWLVEHPDPFGRLVERMDVISQRLEKQGTAVAALSEHPRTRPSPERAWDVAESCLDVLDRVVGIGDRSRVFRAVVRLDRGRAEDALPLLQSVVDATVSPTMRLYASKNMLAAYGGLGQHEQVRAVANTILESRRDDRFALFWLAIANGWLEDSEHFRDAARRFAGSGDDECTSEWWNTQIEGQAAWFSGRLGMTVDEVRQAFLQGHRGGDRT